MMSIIRLFCGISWSFLLMLLAPFFIPITFYRQFPLVLARTVFSPGLIWIIGIKLKIIGRENVPKNAPVIVVSNHSSYADIPCLCRAIPINLHFIGKKELMFVPFVGWYMLMAGHIFINRKSKSKSIISLRKAAIKIREGKSVILFPEGTRSKTGEIGTFKKGAFHLAIQAGVQVIPVNISGTFKVWSKNSNKITPGKVVLKIGKPIDSSKYSKNNVKDFVAEARTAIEELGKEIHP